MCRESARSHIASRHTLSVATERIAWWIRPPDRRVCAIANALPSGPSRFSLGMRTSSYLIHAWLPWPIGSEPVPKFRTMFTPGVSFGTTNIDVPS